MSDSESEIDSISSDYINMCDEDEEQILNLTLGCKTSATPPIEKYKFYVLQTSDVLEKMMDPIFEIGQIMDVGGLAARVLLNHYKWNKVDLINDFVDTYTSKDEMLLKLKLMPNVVKEQEQSVEQEQECKICLCNYSAETLIGSNDCNHRFCKDCWGQYLKTQIFENSCDTVPCAASNCDAPLEDMVAIQLIQEDKVKQKFEFLMTNQFVLCNPLFRWCPAADCMFAIKVTQVEPKGVLCKCGYEFCFGCGEFWHEPITCALLVKWKKTIAEDILSARWIQTNTKKCPKCSVNIEKNAGCNHMTCISCKNEFCWVCFGPWQGHGGCNRYIPPSGDADDEVFSEERHKHFKVRFNNHSQSLKLELLLYKTVEQKMAQLQDMQGLTRNQVLFLRKGIDVLCKSRQILIATYVFAYFAKKSNQLMIFEDNQRDLEKATEALSECVEREITPESLPTIRPTLQDKFIYCEKRQTVLLDHVKEGYRLDWWKNN